MILKVFCIRDAASEYFMNPFYARAHGEAERNFSSAVQDPKSPAFKHPEHYDLYYLGEFDDNSGKFQVLDTPQHVMKAIHVTRENSVGLQSVNA